jgi:hypothetical protein
MFRYLSFIVLVGLGSLPAWSANLTYTLRWDSVNGSYNGNSFSGKTVTVTATADTANLQGFGPISYLTFADGANVKVSVSDVLPMSSVDLLSSNGTRITATFDSRIFLGTFGGNDRGSLVSFTSPPTSAGAWMLTNEWNSPANGSIANQNNGSWLSYTIQGQELKLDAPQTSSGFFGAVPEPSAGALLVVGLGGVMALRRVRRKAD